MDIAPKYSGTAAGLMNTGSALAAIVSPLVAGYVIDATGNWYLPFLMSMGLLLLGGFSAFLMHPEQPFEDAGASVVGERVAARCAAAIPYPWRGRAVAFRPVSGRGTRLAKNA